MKRNLPSHPEAVSAVPGESRQLIRRPENPGNHGPARPVRTEFMEVSFSVKITHFNAEITHGRSRRMA